MRLVLVCPNLSVGHGLALLLKERGVFDSVLEASSLAGAVSHLREGGVDLIAMDAELADAGYERAMSTIQRVDPDVGVVILSTEDDPDDMQYAMAAGARAYLSVTSAPEDLVQTMLTAASGNIVISAEVATELSGQVQAPGKDQRSVPEHEGEELSERELEILNCLARGRTNSETGVELYITENTAKVHVRNILRKLRLRNRQQATAYALQTRLIEHVEFETDGS